MHGFRNSGTVTLHIHAVLAAPFFEAKVEGATEVTRRWDAGLSAAAPMPKTRPAPPRFCACGAG